MARPLRTVKSCVGSTWCRYGVQDSVGAAVRIENRYKGCARRTNSRARFRVARASALKHKAKTLASSLPEKGYNLYVAGQRRHEAAARRALCH